MHKLLKDFFFLIVLFIFPTHLYSQNEHQTEIDSITQSIERIYRDGRFNQYILLKNTTDLYYLSKETGYTQGQLFSIFEEAKIHFINGNLIKSLSKIKEGVNLSMKQKDNNMLCRFLLLYQRLLLELDHLDLSEKILVQAEKYNKLVKSDADRHINNVWMLLAKADMQTYTENKINQKEVVGLKMQAYAMAKKIPKNNTWKRVTEIYSLISLTWSQTFLPNISDAEENEKIIDAELKNYPSDALIILNMTIKGKIEYTRKNYELSVNYYNQALEKSQKTNNFPRLFVIYPLLSDSYQGLKNYEKASYYSNAFKQLVDSVDIVKKRAGDFNSISEINSKILDKNSTAKGNKDIIFGFVAFLLLSCTGIFFYLRLRNKKNSGNIQTEDALPAELSVETGEIVNTHQQSEKTKQLVILAKEDINAFYIEFRKAYPTFYKSLQDQYPGLNISDLNFCSLIKMNFGIKEISQYTNSSIRAAEARRYRINKKMGLKNQNELYVVLSMFG